MTRRVYIVVPGILSATGDNLAWFVRLPEDLMRQHSGPAPAGVEFRYTAGPIFRRVGQQERARQVARIAERWFDSGFAVVLVGHSNGCDLICRAIALCRAHIKAVHLVAAACVADFEANGLNASLLANRLGNAVCYVSKADTAINFFARLSLRLRGFGLGYGTLGADGPRGVAKELSASRVVTIRRDTYGHTDWFNSQNYDSTLANIARHER